MMAMAKETQIHAAIIRDRFEAFVPYAFWKVHGEPLGAQPYVQHLCHGISQFIDGKTTRLLINIPPQHLKSFVGMICLAAYLLGINPKLRIILVAYNDTFAEALCGKIRDMMRSSWYKKAFATRIKEGHARVNDFATEEDGGVFAVGATGSVTGRSADVIIYDDPHEIGQWNNERQLALVADNFNTLLSRLNNKITGRIIVIAHRVSPEDLPAKLLVEKEWSVVQSALVAVETETYDLGQTCGSEQRAISFGHKLILCPRSNAYGARSLVHPTSFFTSRDWIQEPPERYNRGTFRVFSITSCRRVPPF
jgi:hypothetical protein